MELEIGWNVYRYTSSLPSNQEYPMRKSSLGSMLATILLLSTAALADFATPFVETKNKVGDVSEGHGYVLAGDSDDGPAFLVMVTSDTQQHLTILARAEKGIVPADLIGRPVVIRAEVVKAAGKTGSAAGMELKILEVKSTRKPAAGATK
jgi:hypothetical protein